MLRKTRHAKLRDSDPDSPVVMSRGHYDAPTKRDLRRKRTLIVVAVLIMVVVLFELAEILRLRH